MANNDAPTLPCARNLPLTFAALGDRQYKAFQAVNGTQLRELASVGGRVESTWPDEDSEVKLTFNGKGVI